ncbi:MAG: hypothetical protein KKD00_12020 [Gammaproteobacteria bacterium]|nr:hypothetical protein [Gammaproteobacteria bacterium]
MDDTLIPMTLFILIGLCVLIPFYLRYLTNIKKMETLIKLAESGVDLKAWPSNLLSQEPATNSDLRRGAIFIALSLPIILSLTIAEDYQEAALFGGIPLCIGLAYLLVMKFGKREKTQGTSSEAS